MKVIYTAPNRAHHYRYASSLYKANALLVFVSGFSRLSPRAAFDEIKEKLTRADILQTLYLGSLKIGLPTKISTKLRHWAKIEQDLACRKFIKHADIFLFYNGSGLHTCKQAKQKGVITVVEAVNSHVEYQEQILKEEYNKLNIPWVPFPVTEKRRRIEEYNLADYILVPSEFVKRSFLEKGFDNKKILKVPFGFNQLNIQKNKLEKNVNSSFTILFVGSISVRKGVRYLINAFEKLQMANKKLIIVGPRAKTTGIADLKISKEIVFTGVLKGEALDAAYKNADVFCLPTLEEGMALVQGEALSYGLPIITTTNSGGDDLIEDGVEGFLVPIRDADAIHDKLELLSENTNVLTTMKLAAQKRATSLNGWEETGKNLCATLDKVYKNHKGN